MDEIANLVIASKEGDLTAYGELARRLQDMVYGYARSMLGDAHLAEDAAQEAFLHAFRHLGELGMKVWEICRVISAGGTSRRIATSTETVHLSPDQVRAEKRSEEKERGRADPNVASVRRRLRRGPPKGADPVRFHERLRTDAGATKISDLHQAALVPLASTLRDRGDNERAEEVFAKALTAGPSPGGGIEQLAYRHMGLAHRCLERRQLDWAAEAARQALKAWDQAGLKDGIATGRSLALLAEALGEDPRADRVAGYAQAHIEFPRKARTVVVGGGGYDTGRLDQALRGRPWWMSLTLANGRLLLLPAKAGWSWSDSGNFGDVKAGYCRTISRTTEAVDERVTVPAGTFRHCVRVRSDADLSPFTPATPVDESLLGWVRGPRVDWYAPGVGLVKMVHRHANGQATRAELAAYAVKGGQRSYLPGRVGNRWHYFWLDDRACVWGHSFLQVASRYRRTGYLASAGYWYGQ